MRPTIWRTARALANEKRLRFLRAVWMSKGKKTVSELAEVLGLSIPTASVYLRALNARGMISVQRVSSQVFYSDGEDRSLPEAQKLQSAFADLFSRERLPYNWPAKLMPTLKAYSHVRRIAIIRCLALQGMGFKELSRHVSIPEMSLARHMKVLREAEIVACDEKRRYLLKRPHDSLQKVLLEISCPSKNSYHIL